MLLMNLINEIHDLPLTGFLYFSFMKLNFKATK